MMASSQSMTQPGMTPSAPLATNYNRIYSKAPHMEIPDNNCKKPYISGTTEKEFLLDDLKDSAKKHNLRVSHNPHATRKQVCDADRRAGVAVPVRDFSPEVLACGKTKKAGMENMTEDQLEAIAEFYNKMPGAVQIPHVKAMVKDELCANLIFRDIITTDPITGKTSVNIAIPNGLTNSNNSNMTAMNGMGVTSMNNMPGMGPTTHDDLDGIPNLQPGYYFDDGLLKHQGKKKGNPKSKSKCSKRSMVWVKKGKGRKSYCRSHKKM